MTALEFAETARRLGEVCHRLALRTPAFRSPPRDPAANRSVRYYKGGTVVAVRLRDRANTEIIDDMVLGVMVVNNMPQWDPRYAELVEYATAGWQGPTSAQEMEARAFAEAHVSEQETP